LSTPETNRERERERERERRNVNQIITGKWWEYPDVYGRIILRGIFRKWEGVVGTGWSGLRIGTGGGHFWVR
jgi:hypothetical protein